MEESGKVMKSVTSNLENSDVRYVRVEHRVVEQSGSEHQSDLHNFDNKCCCCHHSGILFR